MKHIVGFSGGIDSQACARWAINRFGAESVILTNSNAGSNESPLTEEFIVKYSEQVHPVVRCDAIVADMWKTEGFAERRGFDGSEPLTFGRLIEIKGRPPSPKAQFCTTYLKLEPQKRWIASAFGPTGEYAGEEYERYTGVRRDESDKRKDQAFREWDGFYDCWLNAPIADWTKIMCFDYVKAHGEAFNPLYSLGFGRVGCAPCINSGKNDILLWAQRFPEMIEKVRDYERQSGRTFFSPMVPGLRMNTMDQVLEWAQTDHGGRQKNMLRMITDERPACESKYGLCE